MKSNTILFITCILIYVIAKLWFREAANDDLLFLLTPTNWGVELFTNSQTAYTAEYGYYYSALNISIEKSCSGFNFLLIAFLMISYIFASSKRINVLFILPFSLLLAYLATILANISRIAIYIVLMKQDLTSLLDPNDTWLHRAEGILVYFSFLLIIYFILTHLITKLKAHEEFA